jgi:hypothetical protein
MQMRAELGELAEAVNQDLPGSRLRLREDELDELEALLQTQPQLWPVGLADTFRLLQRKLRMEPIDRQAIPPALLDFFDRKFRRDLDPMALARHIGEDICTACADCTCRC